MEKYLPKSHQQNRPNSAEMLKKLCLKNDDVTYCLVEKKNWWNKAVEKYLFSNEIILILKSLYQNTLSKQYINLILKSRDCPFGGNGSAARFGNNLAIQKKQKTDDFKFLVCLLKIKVCLLKSKSAFENFQNYFF